MALRVAQVAVILAGLLVTTAIVVSSLDRRSYYYYPHQDRSQWEHPTASVALIAGLAVLETVIAFGVLTYRRPNRLWIRALVALAIIVPLSWLLGDYVVHMPGFWLLHLLWLDSVLWALVLMALASAAMHAYALLRDRAHALE